MANFNFNEVILGGRITSNPELKTTPNGVSVTTFSIAVARKANKNETDFISCVAWRTTAEFICRYFSKGSSICVTGSIQTRSWTDPQTNQKRYVTEVIVDEANFVDSKSENTVAPSSQPASQFTVPPMATTPSFANIEDDSDLPF